MKYSERKYPRTLNEAFGPNCSWQSDYERRQDRESPLWWCLAIGLVVVLVALVFSQA